VLLVRTRFLRRIICHPTTELEVGDWVEIDGDVPASGMYGEVTGVGEGEVMLRYNNLDGNSAGLEEEWIPRTNSTDWYRQELHSPSGTRIQKSSTRREQDDSAHVRKRVYSTSGAASSTSSSQSS